MQMSRGVDEDWTSNVPALAALDGVARERLRRFTRPFSAKAGSQIFREGSPCEVYLIVLSGQVRVQKTGTSGREIVLYRVSSGETCVVTTACLMSGVAYDVDGVVETDLVAQALPLAAFRTLLAESEDFRSFVFKAFGARISTLLMRLEEVAFGRIDRRLALRLIAYGVRKIHVTHQELAVELGTAREVVSRRLKDFERDGYIRLGRGSIILEEPQELRRWAESEQAV